MVITRSLMTMLPLLLLLGPTPVQPLDLQGLLPPIDLPGLVQSFPWAAGLLQSMPRELLNPWARALKDELKDDEYQPQDDFPYKEDVQYNLTTIREDKYFIIFPSFFVYLSFNSHFYSALLSYNVAILILSFSLQMCFYFLSLFPFVFNVCILLNPFLNPFLILTISLVLS